MPGSRRLSPNPVAPDIRPDVTVRDGAEVVVIVDAKYKKDEGGPRNPDIYQVITYGTVLRCRDVILLYPQTELVSERDIPIINSPILVKTHRIDISSREAVENAEALAKTVMKQSHLATTNLPPKFENEDGDLLNFVFPGVISHP